MRQVQNRPQSPEQQFLGQHANNVPDLSKLRSTNANPLTGHEPGELTPTERNQCEAAVAKLYKAWLWKSYDKDSPDTVWDQFARHARDLFGEIGFEIDVMWSIFEADGMPGEAAIPQITIMGRVNKHAGTDHDQIKHEVQAGLYDGRKGGMREDGTWREDLTKKSY